MDCNVEIHTLSDEEEMEGDGDAIIFADETGSQPDVITTDEKKKGMRNINLPLVFALLHRVISNDLATYSCL